MALATKQLLSLQLLLANGASEDPHYKGAGSPRWMGLRFASIAQTAVGSGDADSASIAELMGMLRAHESEFSGKILPTRGCMCVASWPGVYAKLW